MEPKAFKVLSIDGWRDSEGGWTWNAWYKCTSECPAELISSNRKLIAWFRKVGLLTSSSAGCVAVDDDQYNKVIVNKNTREPLFAVEYGSEF